MTCQGPSSRTLYQMTSSGRFAYHMSMYCAKPMYDQNTVKANMNPPRL